MDDVGGILKERPGAVARILDALHVGRHVERVNQSDRQIFDLKPHIENIETPREPAVLDRDVHVLKPFPCVADGRAHTRDHAEIRAQ